MIALLLIGAASTFEGKRISRVQPYDATAISYGAVVLPFILIGDGPVEIGAKFFGTYFY